MLIAVKMSPLIASLQVASVGGRRIWKNCELIGKASTAHHMGLFLRGWNGRRGLASETKSDHEHTKPDVLIVGAGAAGMVAALRAKSLGLSPMLIEKNAQIGGTSAYSGGCVWVPNSHLYGPEVEDSIEEALSYMEAVIGDAGPASSRERKLAFLRNAPKMAKFIEAQGFRWRASQGYPDYHPNLPGGRANGRAIEGDIFNVKKLGPWTNRLMSSPHIAPLPIGTFEGSQVYRFGSSIDGFMKLMRVVFGVMMPQKLVGRDPRACGQSLTGQLLHLNLQNGIPIWLRSPMKGLVFDDNHIITGATVERNGQLVTINAARGVLLASGGFSHNSQMRKSYQPSPIGTQWTMAQPGDKGDAISAAVSIGAATALMDDAWYRIMALLKKHPWTVLTENCRWGPVILDKVKNKPVWAQYERSHPHAIVVDRAGNRFTNESQSYVSFVHDQYAQNKITPAIPAYLIIDSRHRKRYPMANMMPGWTLKRALDSGTLTEAETLPELARKVGISVDGLGQTVARFNAMARKGIDEDFDRGATAYDKCQGDPAYEPNPCLGSIEKSPFYAVELWPGDLGTKGGILTDDFARALRDNGTVIEGLYATGNCSASVMGRQYPGPGSTLSPAMTFAYIAMDHMASKMKL